MAYLVSFVTLVGLCSALCSFTQECSDEGCQVPQHIDPPGPPSMQTFIPPFMCPEFAGQEVCCNESQNSQLVTKFMLVDYTFGGGAGGCDACGANLKRLWCYFTCSPDQSTFISAGNQTMVLDPMASTPTYVLVLLLNFTVTEHYACEIYNSCKKCPYAQAVSAMQSSHGFLQFQGANSVEMGMVYITFYFINQGSYALQLDVASCANQAPQLYGFPTKPCSCNK